MLLIIEAPLQKVNQFRYTGNYLRNDIAEDTLPANRWEHADCIKKGSTEASFGMFGGGN